MDTKLDDIIVQTQNTINSNTRKINMHCMDSFGVFTMFTIMNQVSHLTIFNGISKQTIKTETNKDKKHKYIFHIFTEYIQWI